MDFSLDSRVPSTILYLLTYLLLTAPGCVVECGPLDVRPGATAARAPALIKRTRRQAPQQMVALWKRLWNFADSLDVFVALATLVVAVAYLHSSGQLDSIFGSEAVTAVVDKATTAGGEFASALEAAGAQWNSMTAAGLSLVRMGWMSTAKGWMGMMSGLMGWMDMVAYWGPLEYGEEDAQGAPPDFMGLL